MFFRKRRDLGVEIDIDSQKLSRDQLWFVSIFIFKVLLGLTLFSIKPLTGFLFLAAYALYFYKEMRAECIISEDSMEPLTFQPKKKDPAIFWVLSQTCISLALIFISSHIFVKHLEILSISWNMPPLIVSLLISPIATELPEILNAVIWVKQGKETLALGNISGAMMIQTTIPTAFGLFFTPWLFDFHLIWAGVITLISVTYLLITLKRDKLSPMRLVYAGACYLLFSCIFLIR